MEYSWKSGLRLRPESVPSLSNLGKDVPQFAKIRTERARLSALVIFTCSRTAGLC
jgi:hypothetical protein